MKVRFQVILAAVVVLLGIILLFCAFFVPPVGVIDPTVLAALGEILTFAGSLIGVDYHYKIKKLP